MNVRPGVVLTALLLGAAAPAPAQAPAVPVETAAGGVFAPADSGAAIDSTPDSWTAPPPFAVAPMEPFPGTRIARPRVWLNVLLVVLSAALVVLTAVLLYRRLTARRYWREESDAELAPLVFNRPLERQRLDETPPQARTPTDAPHDQAQLPPPSDVTKDPTAGYNAHGDAGGDAGDDEPAGIAIEAGPIRFHRPPAGTLQLLPGRLEIVSGSERQEEIRFVKLPRAAAVVTFGRVAGAAYRHIQLQSPTVSRMHATMQFQGGRWHIENLSHTNPVIVNGRRLAVNGAAEMLSEGDQVEMGEVVFRFRAR